MKVKITEYNIHNGAIKWRILTLDMTHFCDSSHRAEISMFQICDLETLGQGHRVQLRNGPIP